MFFKTFNKKFTREGEEMTKAEIQKEFIGIDGINEAKKIYKNLARKLHPDIGGSTEEFKILNDAYNYVLENGIIVEDDAEFDLELEKVISKILHYEDLIIEVVGSWIWLSGETKAIKEILKELKFKWASKKKKWYYGEMKGRNPKQKSMNDIKAKYGCTTVATKANKRIA